MIQKIAILFIMILVSMGCDKKEATSDINIGAILPLTGNASKIGLWQKKGIELARDRINKNNDIKINVIFKDSMSNPKNAILAYRNLTQNNKIDTIISSLTSVSMAIQSSSEKNKKALIMLAVSHPTITNNRKYSIRFNLGSEDESLELSKYLNKKKYKSVCVVYINNDFGIMASKVLEDNLHNITFTNGYLAQSSDLRALSEKIIRNKCEALSVIGYTNSSILLIKQLRELGGKQDVFTNMALSIPSFQKLGGESLKGVKYTATNFGRKKNIKSTTFITNYKKVYNENPTFFASFAYDALTFIYKNKIENKPITTDNNDSYTGTIGKINIIKGNLKTDVSINQF